MPEGETIPMAKKLDFKVTNNMAEYEAYIYGVQAALAAGAKNLLVYGDSLLIISQANEEWEVKEERLKPYHGYLKTRVSINASSYTYQEMKIRWQMP